MSRFKLELCSYVVKENYGELVEKVAMFLAKNGSSQLRTIIKRTECNVKQASAVYPVLLEDVYSARICFWWFCVVIYFPVRFTSSDR